MLKNLSFAIRARFLDCERELNSNLKSRPTLIAASVFFITLSLQTDRIAIYFLMLSFLWKTLRNFKNIIKYDNELLEFFMTSRYLI